MSLGRRAGIVALILLAVMIVAFPLAGCGKKQTAAPGDQTQGGGAPPGSGNGVPATGKTWAYGQLMPGEHLGCRNRIG